jgi:hypothetical protein
MPATSRGRANGSPNRLLASLPAEEFARVVPALARVELEVRRLCFDVDRPIAHVCFPEAAVVSILGVMADGNAVETVTVGRAGRGRRPPEPARRRHDGGTGPLDRRGRRPARRADDGGEVTGRIDVTRAALDTVSAAEARARREREHRDGPGAR